MYFNEEQSQTNLDHEFQTSKNQNFKFNINLKFLIICLIIIITIITGIILAKKVFITKTHLVLTGDSDIIIYQHTLYEEPGFKAYDNHGNDLTNEVIVNGEVNTEVVGEYTITYTLDKKTIHRTISVVATENQITYLILNGSSVIFLKVGEQYQEPGYIVIDNLEDNLANKVNITGDVNTNIAGSYKLKYSVTNKSNTTITEERTIIVIDSSINVNYSPTNITNQAVTININVTDNYFDYIALPDGTKSTNRITSYKVTNNNVYKFTIYSKNGSYKEQTINIENIDKQAPTGSCNGYYKNGKSYITINAKDNLSISKYLINNETFTNNQITYNKELSTAKIQIYDKANNQTTISCNLENKNPPPVPSSTSLPTKPSSGTNYPQSPTSSNDLKVYYFTGSNGSKMSYWLYVPEGYTSNMPLIIFLHGSGEAGNDYVNKTQKAITWGPGRDINKRNAKFNAIILMPQTTGQWSSSVLKNVKEISDQIVTQYKIDKQRISLSGFSLGCIAIPNLLELYPNYFSAAVPIECQRPSDLNAAKKYVNISTWTFASQDYTNNGLKKLTTNIKSLGGYAQHTYFPNMGHTGLVGYRNYSIFTDTQLNLVNWMTSQQKK